MVAEPEKRVLIDHPHGLDPVLVEIWPDGDVVLKQGSEIIQLSETQIEKLIKSLSS